MDNNNIKNNNNVDLFSRLTFPLLTLIVSLLPFKEAVRTSILSRQWRDVWRETKNVELDEKFFVRPQQTQVEQCVRRGVFVGFVRQFIRNYPGTAIDKFSLSCSKPDDFPNDMNELIAFAVSHNVKELEVDFSDPAWEDENDVANHGNVFELPPNLYQHGGLESLQLFSCNFDVSRFTSVVSLKNLSLGRITTLSIRNLLATFPMLETLTLSKCRNIEPMEINMNSLRIKNLVLDKCTFIQDCISLDGPKLRTFKYKGKVGYFYLVDQREMVEAQLDFGLETEFEEVGDLLCQLMEQLFSVRVLTVCSVLLQMIPSGDEPFMGIELPLNVRHLIVKTAVHPNEFCGFKFMLNSCPLLHTLTLHIGPEKIFPDYVPPYPFDPQDYWSKISVSERCVDRKLKVVNIKGFKGTWNELQVIGYILYFGRAMQQLNIYISNEEGDNGENLETYMERAQLVMQFARASQNIRLSFLRDDA